MGRRLQVCLEWRVRSKRAAMANGLIGNALAALKLTKKLTKESTIPALD